VSFCVSVCHKFFKVNAVANPEIMKTNAQT
jgi:hypothetical protein